MRRPSGASPWTGTIIPPTGTAPRPSPLPTDSVSELRRWGDWAQVNGRRNQQRLSAAPHKGRCEQHVMANDHEIRQPREED